MKIIVSEIPEEGLELNLKDDVKTDAVSLTSPVTAVLRLDKVGENVIAKGALSGDADLQCARCLTHFPMRLSSQVNVVYHPAKDIAKSEQHELKGDELDTVFYRDDVIDTDDLLREQLLLSLPMKPLCSPDCRGFCPKCGSELNVEGCRCEKDEVDPRFDVLKRLKQGKE
ncbi:MAG TPA: DUF177 domain-containing protein [Dissulfurispiraceae bacterium]|nr:DUF177 domain-containing protein [Dissulfurispiraceae bacterium]